MANNWHGAGELWKNEVENRLADPQKRKDFYGDKAVRQVGKKLLGAEYKKEDSADAVVTKLKERQDITKDDTILKNKSTPEKVIKGRLLSAIVSDFFAKECGSKQANADALIALKYLNAELDNVDWLEEGETVSITHGVLTIEKDGQIVAQGALLDRAKLPPNSPAAISRRGTIKKKSKEARGKITMAPGQIPGGISAPPEGEPSPLEQKFAGIKASLDAQFHGSLNKLIQRKELATALVISGNQIIYPYKEAEPKFLNAPITGRFLQQNILHLNVAIKYQDKVVDQEIGVDLDRKSETALSFINDAINGKIIELQHVRDREITWEEFRDSPLLGRMIDILGHQTEYYYKANNAHYRMTFKSDHKNAEIEVIHLRLSDGRRFKGKVDLDVSNHDDTNPEKVDAKILEKLQKFEDYVDPKKTERMRKRAAGRRRRSGHGG